MADYSAGTDQVIVTYRTDSLEQTMGRGLTRTFMDIVASDAATRAADGWRIVTLDTLASESIPTGDSPTAGGTTRPADVIVTVVYARPG
jgi:hypothetical protein